MRASRRTPCCAHEWSRVARTGFCRAAKLLNGAAASQQHKSQTAKVRRSTRRSRHGGIFQLDDANETQRTVTDKAPCVLDLMWRTKKRPRPCGHGLFTIASYDGV